MPRCRLCNEDRELRESHIVPKFLYSDLHNAKHQMMGINGRGNRGWKALQDGAFEKPFRKLWVDNFPLLDPWTADNVYWMTVDYASFKLFHLSVFFRAGVSTLPTFSVVKLGPHEETLLQLLLNKNPGKFSRYPISGHAVILRKTKQWVQMVSQAQVSRIDGRRCYGIMHGGVEWWLCVASDRNPDFEQIGLQPDGRMPFAARSKRK